MKSFSILGGKAHVVELPEGATDFHVCNVSGYEYFSCFFIRTYTVNLPPGTWQIVGLLPEVTEEQAGEIVDKLTVRDTVFYYNYNSKSGRDYRDIVDSSFKTALESLKSAICAEGWYFENPYSRPPYSDKHGVTKDFWLHEYHHAQSRVLCRERCLVLRRTDI